ncbi:hypothetical protein I4F81_000544 [Pyropia yezoensis]|uniref:Uncharacterized protein n=1 Tax=Pyropia yezoensis TaxID=2788 RepID=A0ACC3BJL1_PYRYE|nr:hypothetical protein I4F81_000544 [Neopyropia yezoensis]
MLSLRDFLRRSSVLSLYRQALRVSKEVPGGGDEIARVARHEIRARRDVPSDQVDKLVADGHGYVIASVMDESPPVPSSPIFCAHASVMLFLCSHPSSGIFKRRRTTMTPNFHD